MRLYVEGKFVECEDDYIAHSPFLTCLSQTKVPTDKYNGAFILDIDYHAWLKYYTYLKGHKFIIESRQEMELSMFMGHSLPETLKTNIPDNQLWIALSTILYMKHHNLTVSSTEGYNILMNNSACDEVLVYDIDMFKSHTDVRKAANLYELYSTRTHDFSVYKSHILKLFITYFIPLMNSYDFTRRGCHMPYCSVSAEGLAECLQQYSNFKDLQQVYNCIMLYTDFKKYGLLYVAYGNGRIIPELDHELKQLSKDFILYFCTEWYGACEIEAVKELLNTVISNVLIDIMGIVFPIIEMIYGERLFITFLPILTFCGKYPFE